VRLQCVHELRIGDGDWIKGIFAAEIRVERLHVETATDGAGIAELALQIILGSVDIVDEGLRRAGAERVIEARPLAERVTVWVVVELIVIVPGAAEPESSITPFIKSSKPGTANGPAAPDPLDGVADAGSPLPC
jgi:hypothetical protein